MVRHAMLERFRKQAKLYLRWHRTGYHPVAARIRATLPRFRSLSDHEILAERFRLADAQALVARMQGFDSWLALRKGLDKMPEANPSTPDRATLIAAEPQLFVADVAASSAWYGDKLGFEITYLYGEPPFYAQLVRDGARLNLRQVEGAVFADDLKAREGDVLSVSITVDDIRPLFAEIEGRGATIHQRPRLEPWGARTFIVADPDGNLILFASAGSG
jgi:catechol 2,3-dioxygenase-like lactoylglutathione lyase family enzyme